jgi:diguanylate cyclase (GGDEF)-like protein
MKDGPRLPRSTARLFVVYAVCSLVPIVLLGVVLAAGFRAEANRRGLAQGRAEATLVAQTAVEPLLQPRPLTARLSAEEMKGLQRIVWGAVGGRHVLRLRLRDLAGKVVFSADGSGLRAKADDEAIAAARGHTIAKLTHINSDTNDTGRAGVLSVEVYIPLMAVGSERRIGVLEIYVPYAPIGQAVRAGLQRLYVDLAMGLGLLYVVLFGITVSVSRGLRHEASVNAFLAEHDTLTGLPNRALFHRRAAAAVIAAQSTGSAVIAILDLDRFKEVNDTLGHHNGDRLLVQLAQRLDAAAGPGDTIARLGGDEFGLVLTDGTDPEAMLQRVRRLIDQEVEVGGLPLSAQASIGFVVAPQDGTDVDRLLQMADVAMYVAKEQHAGIVRYSAELDHYDASSLTLVSELRRAIADDRLVLHYQPQETLLDGTIVAVEALVRWQHPVHGLLYPDRFLPLAEQTDIIEELTVWVLSTALRDISALGSRHRDLRVAVNVSARSLSRASFAGEVCQAIARSEIAAERVVIEVTETALLTDRERAATVLRALAAEGVNISLDDFGRGQTSLGYLSELPIHELKIDRSFVTDMVDNASHAAIVDSVVDLGHNLGFSVVAEGIETAEVRALLQAVGCDLGQGYLLARPMPLAQLIELLGSDPHGGGITHPTAVSGAPVDP